MKKSQTQPPGISIDFFIQDPAVQQEIAFLKSEIEKELAKDPDFGFSDVRDQEGHSYVDLVQEGGGVLGIALVGYTYALEQAGIRFLKMAGTSAGAINTALLAAADKPEKAKSEKILKAIAELDILSFVDGDRDAKKFFDSLVENKGKVNLLYRGLQVIDNFKDFLGLNPGEVFYDWLAETIESYGIKTVQDLRKRMQDLPEEIKEAIYPADSNEDDWPFALVAADITTESKTIMPEHGSIYFTNPEEVHPAYYVRASMAVPLFFHPLHRDPAHAAEKRPFLGQPLSTRQQLWKEKLHYDGPMPDKVMFVDGGILSNFPIDIFHNWDKIPRRPTFGIKLGASRNSFNKVEEMTTFGLIGAAFNSARNMRDLEYFYNNPELKQLVGEIDTLGQNWLNFALTNEEKLTLFRQGVKAAVSFLTDEKKKFSWKQYKEGRRNQLLTFVDRLNHDLGLLETAEQAAGTRTRSISKSREEERQKEKSMAALQKRLASVKVFCDKIDILWMDYQYDAAQDSGSDYEKNTEEKLPEIRFLESLNKDYEIHCIQPDAVEATLRENPQKYDLAVFYLQETDYLATGEQFLQQMVERSEWDTLSMPPTIFYCKGYHQRMGIPTYAFGITHSPTELIHLIIDVLQRRM